MDFCTELSKGVVSKLGELGVESTLKQFKYMIQYKKIIANLKEEHENLNSLKQTLQGWVEAESRKGNEIPPNISKWLSNEAAVEIALHNFYENKVNKNKKCFLGQCPNLTFNYSLGKQATKRIENITKLKEDGNKLSLIPYRKPAPALASTFIEDYKSLESRKKIIIALIEKLKDDQLKRIGICGMGGVGKTTLVKELIKTLENKLFDKVVMATVSQNPDYEKIQRKFSDDLELELKGQSVEGRGGEILQRLLKFEDKKDKVLIVLDDVWKELNFEWLGLPSQEHQKCIKILFTSRDEKVCQKNRSQENVHVSVLLQDEAWSLFQEMAGDVVNKPDIYPIAREVANECAGLPLAIVTIGRALENEEKFVWEDALQQLRKSQSTSFLDMQECVYSRIELSFNFLGSEEHKSCLFLCGLFPEDFDIPIESLLRHGVGLGLFKAIDNVWKARNHIKYLVKSLKKGFLLLDSEEPGCVKMHDIVRDVVLKISLREELGIFVQSNSELQEVKQRKEKCLRMSLILNEKIDLESDLECPTLELLQVQSQIENGDTPLWPENFIHGMTKLKVLYLENLCIPKTSSHFHASFNTSVNLHTLQLEGCDVGDISIIGKEVKKLEILSFANSNIEELPAEIGNLGFLKLLDLTGCDYLEFISPNVLARLSQLEELYFRTKNFPWLLNKEVVEELRYISPHLKVLEIKVRKLKYLPNDLIFKNLEFFWISIVPYDSYERFGYLVSNIIQLRALDYNSIKSSMMTMHLINKCEILKLEKVVDLKSVISELDDCGLQCVKDLRIDSCPNLDCIIDCNTPLCALPLIKSLSLKNLTGLREIIRAHDHSETNEAVIKFSNLEKLKLKCLQKLIGFSNSIYLNDHHQPIHHGLSYATKFTDLTNIKDGEVSFKSHSDPVGCIASSASAKLFSSNWMKQFPKLETISLKFCISLEVVFDLEGYSESSGNTLDSCLLPQLRELIIASMKNLTYVWGNVLCCVQGFHNLRFLTISDCDSLKYVFTSNMVRAITNLEELDVSSCAMIENIVVWSRDDNEDDNVKRHVTTIGFNKLSCLSLSKLPKLVNVYSDSFEFQCPSLTEFNIVECPMLEISLLPPHMHTNQDNINVTYSTNTENNSSFSTWASTGCRSFLPKFIRQRTTNKRVNKEVSLPRPLEDRIPYLSERKSKKVKIHMPVLEELCIRKCDLLDVLFIVEEKFNFPVLSHLQTIRIEKCDKLKVIMARSEEIDDMINSFTQLNSLDLIELPNLVRFCFSGISESWDKEQDMDEQEGDHIRIACPPLIDESFFPNITSLCIYACHKINILFSLSSISGLKHLQMLEVADCENMEEIISHQEKIEAISSKIVFHALEQLLLIKLPNLKAFSQCHYNLNFPSLEAVVIEDCPNMEVFSRGFSDTPKLEDLNINIESVTNNYVHHKDINAAIHGFNTFVALQRSEILNWTELCDKGMFGYFVKERAMNITRFLGLSMLVPFSEIQLLQHVRKLNVSNCDSLVEVFESVGEVTKKGDATTHYQLESMSLIHLPRLGHIWNHNITEVIFFKNLTNIKVLDCKNLKSLLSHSMARSLVQLQKIVVKRCEMMEEIITKGEEYMEGGNKVKTVFPKLEELRLVDLPKLECVFSGYYDYDIPLCIVEEDKEFNNNDKVKISFPELKELKFREVPKLKCFCSGAYNYDIRLLSIEECPNMRTFPHGNVIVNTPNLHTLHWDNMNNIQTLGDLNLTIYYCHNYEKYMAELQKLETFRDVDEELLGYIKRVTQLKLRNCIPSNMMHLFSHVKQLKVDECECTQEIFESNDCMLKSELEVLQLFSLPNLKHIWKNHGQILRFECLKTIIIRQCNDLEYVLPDVSMVTSLPYLYKISVCECEKMKEIIGNNFNPITCVQQKAKIKFPRLFRIKLEKLSSLRCFSQSSFPCHVEMPQCKSISIKDCLEMKTFWYDGNLYTPNLEYLYVDNKFDNDEDVNEVIVRHCK